MAPRKGAVMKLHLLFLLTCFQLFNLSLGYLPTAIRLILAYQASFPEVERAEQLVKIKDLLSTGSKDKQPLKSPIEVLQDGEILHDPNETASDFEWIVVYMGQDIIPAFILYFLICSILIPFLIFKYCLHILKPKLSIEKRPQFPIVPLKYLQETKEEQRVFVASRNTVRWVSNRYTIMASDNVVNLKMLHFGQNPDDQRRMKNAKHRAWFLLRVLAKFNGIYLQNKIKDETPPIVDPTGKISELIKIRRLQAHQAELVQTAEEARKEKDSETTT